MTNLYSNRGYGDSDEEDANPWSYKEPGIMESNFEADDV
jgi:hypothetical protein